MELNHQGILKENFKTNTMKNLVAAVFLLGSVLSYAQGSLGDVVGEVVDGNGKAKIYNATVIIDDNGTLYRAKTEMDGRFRISGIPSGTYLIKAVYFGDTSALLTVTVPIDGYGNVGAIPVGPSDLAVSEQGPVVVTAKDGIKLEYGELPVREISAKDLKHSPVKFSPKDLIVASSSDVRMTPDGDLVFRGARKGDMIYMMDGVKSTTIGTVPSCAIQRMKIYTGGLPAKYGDTLGGVVVMETKSYFDLYREWYGEQLANGGM